MITDIDITFDFRRDTPKGRDPDAHSNTLRRYHRLLWSKKLPSGETFTLQEGVTGHYLLHRSNLGEYSLTSDTVIPTFRWNKQIMSLITQDELEAFRSAVYTIGGMMVFPGNRIGGKWTINQARGCTRNIGDRFDLTLESIRRYYLGKDSPLYKVFARYSSFFKLFESFEGYVNFFLLNDLVSSDYSAVKISQPFNNFVGSPIPSSVSEYKAYEHEAREFIQARNQRILQCG